MIGDQWLNAKTARLTKDKTMQKYEAHVMEEGGYSYCGQFVSPYSWYFAGKQHAKNSKENGTRMQPCPKCMVIIEGGNR